MVARVIICFLSKCVYKHPIITVSALSLRVYTTKQTKEKGYLPLSICSYIYENRGSNIIVFALFYVDFY